MSDFGEAAVLVPDLVEPIRAYRMWAVDETGLLLRGRSPWMPGEDQTATCHRSTYEHHYRHRSSMSGYGYEYRPAPAACDRCPSPTRDDHDGYGCGIYAYKDYADSIQGGGGIAGEVQLWGTVYEHAGGWRAEHARIVRLFRTRDADDQVLERLAVIYDVPLEDPLVDEPERLRALARGTAKAWHDRQAAHLEYLNREARQMRQEAQSPTKPLPHSAAGSGGHRVTRAQMKAEYDAMVLQAGQRVGSPPKAKPDRPARRFVTIFARSLAITYTALAILWLILGLYLTAAMGAGVALVCGVTWLVRRRNG